jgi:uncharacterized metal-binding protein YceD (DUF177 family)
MKITISSISKDGLKVKDFMQLDSLNTRLAAGRSNEIVFTEPPVVDVMFNVTCGGVEAKGQLKTRYKQLCPLCLDSVQQDLDLDINMIFTKKPDAIPGTSSAIDEKYEDDVGIYYYQGDQIDFEDPLQEAIILSLRLYWRPPVDQNGLCKLCGKDTVCAVKKLKPSTTKLGDLLAKAVKEKIH